MFEMKFPPLIDGHVHGLSVAGANTIPKLMDVINAKQAGIACQSDLNVTNDNPAGFVLKVRHPERFYVLAGLEHSGHLHNLESALSLSQQAHRLKEIGTDGIKLLASKPTERKRLCEPLDGPYFREFFSVCEELNLPLLWHVADPEEFWEYEKLPQWAKEKGWGYDRDFQSKEELYRETENVLRRHPRLCVVFPHVYFLSADLERAERFFSEFPNANFDLAPGIELYYNLSLSREKARDFFCRFSSRILFGTDILSCLSPGEARARAGIIYRFLTEKESFRVPEEADFLLGPPEDGIIHGLDLPEAVVKAVLQDNFRRLFGRSPEKLNVTAAREECLRLAGIEASVKSCPLEDTEGAKAEKILTQI
ncbi:MAG: amidohydrolase family protein [Candidatus Aminicenantes bacterium]|nr:amidohydrolase family protein [Candidatus Aminicenantes bacterium]